MNRVFVEAKPMLLPPAPDKCQECAVKHNPEAPHDATSLYYAMKFKMENGRDCTWEDALAHCDEALKSSWREALRKNGVDTTSTRTRGNFQ